MGKLWDLIVGKREGACAELAREIAALENKLVRIEVDAAEAEKKCLELRQRKLGGDNVAVGQIEKADVARRNAELDLGAGQQSLATLQTKLHAAAEGELASETQRVLDATYAKRAEQKKARMELAKQYAGIIVDLIKIEGGFYSAAHKHVEELERGTPEFNAFKAEVEQLAKGRNDLTYGLRGEADDLNKEHEKLKTMPAETFADNILSKARAAADNKGASDTGEEVAA